jgi:flagellar protein FlaD
MLELLSVGLVLGLKDKKIDLGELNEKALEEGNSEMPPFGEVVKTDAEDEDLPPFFSEAEDKAGDTSPLGESPSSEESFEQVAPVSNEAISQLEERVSEISDAVAKIETLVNSFDERISKIERSMESLLSVYELVTNEINPFIGYSNGTESGNGSEQEEKREKSVLSATPEGQMLKEHVVDKEMMDIKPNGERVRLTQINNDPNSLLLLFKWLDFLIKKVGYQGMIKTLLFYEEVGWITREVRDQIIKYSRDLGGTRASRGNRKLTILEHIISLFFIIKLQGLEVSPTLYSEVVNQLDESGIV